MDDIANEQEEKEKFRIRRTVAREERRAQGPPRLGKHRYVHKTFMVGMSVHLSLCSRRVFLDKQYEFYTLGPAEGGTLIYGLSLV
jgi:hypothetical protein